MKITERAKEALRILADHGGPMLPREFGDRFWPKEHLIHRRSVPCGHGSHRGGGAYRCAGGYLGRLRKLGLVEDVWRSYWDEKLQRERMRSYGYRLTPAGKNVLK